MGNSSVNDESAMNKLVHDLTCSDNSPLMCHIKFGEEPFPDNNRIKQAIKLCRAILFPGFVGSSDIDGHNLENMLYLECYRLKSILDDQITAGLVMGCKCREKADLPSLRRKATGITSHFLTKLPQLRTTLYTDVEAIFDGDPAAISHEEVIYCYPAIKAIANYRIAHELLLEGVPILPRMITEFAHSETGIDIHPGASIGHHFSIDHGTGVVIGATAIIGNNVKLYQGVTLGAKSFDTDENGNPIKGVPRHPIIGNNVIIYSNASVLGRITIGDNAIVGGNLWVTSDVAPGERLIQAKANNVVRLKNNNE